MAITLIKFGNCFGFVCFPAVNKPHSSRQHLLYYLKPFKENLIKGSLPIVLIAII